MNNQLNQPLNQPGPDVIEPLSPIKGVGDLFEALLKKPHSLAAHLLSSSSQGVLNLGFLSLIIIALVLYGVIVGAFSMHEQLWASPLKILIGTMISALICFPSLYIFTCLTGTPAGVKVMLSGLLATLALMAVLLVGFCPIIWVFAQSTNSLGFMGALMLVSWLISYFFAIGFLYKILRQSGAIKLGALRVWVGIFLLVTLQMSTSLRPLIGRSDSLFSTEKRFFLQHWGKSIGEVIVEDSKPVNSTNPPQR